MYTSFLAIKSDVESCQKCELAKTRTNTVFGEGSVHAKLMFVGEGPGKVEDETGRPFVGPAGELLTKMIAAIGLERKDVYIANVVKCRPPGNADPTQEWASACIPYLREQVRFIRPKVIVCLGRIAAAHILGENIAITKMHGKVVERKSFYIVPTFHPSALLRNPDLKRDAWSDFKKIAALLEEGKNAENI